MLQHSEEQQIEQSPSKPHRKPSGTLGSVRIDLVKAQLLGLTLQQACALSVVHQLINKELAAFADINEERWWFIDGITLHVFAESAAGHPSTGTQHLLVLQRKGLIEIDEIDTCLGVKAVLRIKSNVILMGDDA